MNIADHFSKQISNLDTQIPDPVFKTL
jgi:hypothetical protein